MGSKISKILVLSLALMVPWFGTSVTSVGAENLSGSWIWVGHNCCTGMGWDNCADEPWPLDCDYESVYICVVAGYYTGEHCQHTGEYPCTGTGGCIFAERTDCY
jgi:hypothetical protein